MAAQYMRPSMAMHDPGGGGDEALRALVTASSFVALADGRVAAVERDEAVRYIHRRQITANTSEQRVGELFDACVQRLKERDAADLILQALRPVARLSLSSDVIRASERVAAADGHVHPREVEVIRLIQLIVTSFQSLR